MQNRMILLICSPCFRALHGTSNQIWHFRALVAKELKAPECNPLLVVEKSGRETRCCEALSATCELPRNERLQSKLQEM